MSTVLYRAHAFSASPQSNTRSIKDRLKEYREVQRMQHLKRSGLPSRQHILRLKLLYSKH